MNLNATLRNAACSYKEKGLVNDSMQQRPDTRISTSDNNAPTPQRAIHFTPGLQLRKGVWGMLCPPIKYSYVKWLEQQSDLNLFHSVSFPREPVCGTIIKLAETLSGQVQLLFLLARLRQHGLQLRLARVTRGKVKLTSVII